MTVSSTTSNTDPFLNASLSSSSAGANSPSSLASDFSALTTAIEGGHTSAAQQALSQLEEDSPTMAKAIQHSDSSSPLSQLAQAVQSGNMDDAKQALAALQAAIKARQQGSDPDDGASDDSSAESSDSSPIAPDGTGSILNVSA